jgi:hypothetical protein
LSRRARSLRSPAAPPPVSRRSVPVPVVRHRPASGSCARAGTPDWRLPAAISVAACGVFSTCRAAHAASSSAGAISAGTPRATTGWGALCARSCPHGASSGWRPADTDPSTAWARTHTGGPSLCARGGARDSTVSSSGPWPSPPRDVRGRLVRDHPRVSFTGRAHPTTPFTPATRGRPKLSKRPGSPSPPWEFSSPSSSGPSFRGRAASPRHSPARPRPVAASPSRSIGRDEARPQASCAQSSGNTLGVSPRLDS